MKIEISKLSEVSGVCFGTSGVRGLVESMTATVCYAYTVAFLNACSVMNSLVLIGHDLRPSSPHIAKVCAQACRDTGCRVLYAGALPTPALAAYGENLGIPVIVVTGSHVPFDRNGIKFYRTDGEILKDDERAIQSSVIEMPQELIVSCLPEADSSARQFYVHRYVDFFGEKALAGLRVAVYEHSSVARDLLGEIFQSLGAQVISLGRTDKFVPIDTEAVRAEDVLIAKEWAITHKFDAIVSTDGDADRPLIGDETGTWLRGDVVGIISAQFLSANIVVTPINSNTAAELSRSFDLIVRTKIGSPYVVSEIKSKLDFKDAIIVGFEANGGFLLGSNIERNNKVLPALCTRDAVLPMICLLSASQANNKSISRAVSSLPCRHTHSDRIKNFPSVASNLLITTLENDIQRAAKLLASGLGDVTDVNVVDGLRISFAFGDIIHLRQSGNAPELRCYVESSSAERAALICEDILRRIVDLFRDNSKQQYPEFKLAEHSSLSGFSVDS